MLGSEALTEEDWYVVTYDLAFLGYFQTLIGNGVLEDSGQVEIQFCNRSVQQFLAAYWLSNYVKKTGLHHPDNVRQVQTHH
jgi:hypothetical protein